MRTRIATWEVAPAKGPGDPVSFTVARVGGAEMIYVVDSNGGDSRLLRTADRGQSWCVAASPPRPVGLLEGNGATWYLATESARRGPYQLWRSRDEGRTWSELGAPLPEPPTAVWTWPSLPGVVWARTSDYGMAGTRLRYRDQVWRGQEGGGAWELLAPRLEVTGWKDPGDWYWVEADPRMPERLLALLTLVVKQPSTGVESFVPWLMQSDDRGATWAHAADVPGGARVHHAHFDDQDQLVVIQVSGEMSVRARDGSWSTRGRIGDFEAAHVVSRVPGGRELYVQGWVRDLYGPFAILKSLDQGMTWTKLYEGWPPHSVVTAGAGAMTVWDAGGVRWSADDGQTWRPLAIAVRASDLLVPANARSIYTRSFQKVMASHDGGETWDVAPLTFELMWSVTVAATDPQRLVAVIQGAGAKRSVQRSVDGGRRWQALNTLADARPWDGIRAVQETGGTSPALVASDSKGMYRSTDDGATWTEVSRYGANRFYTLAAHPAAIFARTGAVGRSTDGGLTWQWYTQPGDSTQSINDLAIDPADASTVYVVFRGRLFRAASPGDPWTELRILGDRVLSSNLISDGRIALSAERPGTIMVVDGNGELIGSGDGGRNWFTFDELPRGAVRSVAFGPRGSSLLYVMTTVGLFKTRI